MLCVFGFPYKQSKLEGMGMTLGHSRESRNRSSSEHGWEEEQTKEQSRMLLGVVPVKAPRG